MRVKMFLSFVVIAVLGGGAVASLLDLDSQPTGKVISELNGVKVYGFNPNMGPLVNAAIIFDSANPTGGDTDLGTPNSAHGGPGFGAAGAATNLVPLGKLLIIAENLTDNNGDNYVDSPDDADLLGAFFTFDFSCLGKGKKVSTVTINSLTFVDIEADQGEGGTFIELSGPDLPVNLIAIPPSGDNGVVTVDGINLSGVSFMKVQMNGSGAMESVTFNEEEPGVCWFTFGGFQNAGIQSGGKDFTFGGNVGPPPSGSIEVIDHNTKDNFHTNDVHITKCDTVPGTGPGQPGGKKGFKINRAFFEGTGRLNGVKGYPCEGFVIDSGEPAGKKNNNKDFFEIVVRDPNTNAIVFKASGELDGGNVQLHPPTGHG